ncbi:MAG: hypothetical protein AAF622_12780 [Cyanobacteria bacterium P01_C01_bin.147]
MIEVLLAIGILGAIVWWLRQRRSAGRRLAPTRRGRTYSKRAATPDSLLRRLDRLTKDRRVSERLIERVEFNHPGRSKQWCVEKAIYDIQRDRRS